MKALLLESPKNFQRIDIEAPAKPGPGEALVRVHTVGVCGTDISGFLGKMPFFSYPRIPGHELGVEVVAVGEGVANVKPGDRCSVEPYINCQQCYACRKGKTNCCEKHQTLGVHCDGGLRPQFLVPARKLHVSTKLAFEQLALVETLAIGCHAVDRAALQADESCLIIGAGPIGLSTLEFAKLTGAKIIMLDMNEQRLEFCRKTMGVSHTLLVNDQMEAKLKEMTDGHGPDVVIDATGSVQSMSNSFGLIAHGGRLVFVGITTEEVKFRHPVFHRPEGTLLCSRNALSRDFSRIINLIEAGQINTDPWITHRTAFEDVIDVFPSYTRPETGVIKAIIEVGE
ncbi:MAG TPA: zinc-binding alcohol dehydrogenase family protein [Planctomycetaceae bacterium]|nr:zinc-binding alcohol dehydrogenase family protein [Planctomycetaceae bacterium]